jgi:hypothetical protein
MNRQSATTKTVSKATIVSVGLVVGLVATQSVWSGAQANALTDQRNAPRVQTAYEGETPAVQVVSDSGDDQSDVYDPEKVYQGAYEPQRIYRVVLGPQTWRANQRPEQLRDVTCREARTALSQVGTWYGRITEDGSCVSGDETNWAMGNFLNFQMRPHKTDADL